MRLETIVNSWLLSSELHSIHPPATEAAIRSLETAISHRIPSALRNLYLFSNGPELLSGNLHLFPLKKSKDGKAGLFTYSNQLRKWKWYIPKEVLVFANDGSESHFGIWLPETRNKTFRNPIIELGESSASNCMTIVGTAFIPFLLGWTAYYLLLYEADSASLDAIGVPLSLRDKPRDDDLFADLRRWADPTLPDPYPNPYTKGYTVEELKKLFSAGKTITTQIRA